MSKELAIRLDSPELLALEKSKAQQIKATFEPMVNMLNEFEASCQEIFELAKGGITEEIVKKAKRLRIDVGKVRIQTEHARKIEKEEYLRAGKAIDGVSNILKWAVLDKEKALKKIEDHFIILEQQRLDKLQSNRAEKLSLYVEDAHDRSLASMEEDVWQAYFNSKKQAYEDEQEAIRKAEKERIAKEKAEAEERKRIAKENEKLKKEAEERERLAKIEAEKRAKAEAERIAKEEKERKKIEAEKNRKTEELRLKAITFLFSVGFENTHGGMQAKDYPHFIGALHYSEFDKDSELETFKIGVMATKEKEELKAKEIKEAKVRERLAREEQARREKLEAELKAKKEEEARIKAEQEEREQAELKKGDAEKVIDLENDIKAIRNKYSFSSKANIQMYQKVINDLDMALLTISKSKGE